MDRRPIVIAHRGASGYLPEHTLESKALAHGMGADYIEQDVVATRDSVPIVLHDIVLDDVTDVAAVFPGRSRADGRHYAVDFLVNEIRQLRVQERRRTGTREPEFPNRFRPIASRFRIATLSEEFELIQGLKRSTGREVGVYTEVKDPSWHRAHDIDLSALVLSELHQHGYRTKEDRAFVQCFDSRELRRIRDELGTRLKLVQLLPFTDSSTPLMPEVLAGIADYAVGVGLPFSDLVTPIKDGGPYCSPTPLVDAVKDAGLWQHPYTFRRDQVPAWAPSFEELLRFFLEEMSVDGIFCDHPDVAVSVRNSLKAGRMERA
jgi:glycerophosphoryl diester phosphodiesterase